VAFGSIFKEGANNILLPAHAVDKPCSNLEHPGIWPLEIISSVEFFLNTSIPSLVDNLSFDFHHKYVRFFAGCRQQAAGSVCWESGVIQKYLVTLQKSKQIFPITVPVFTWL
jgi:hypothetical protein